MVPAGRDLAADDVFYGHVLGFKGLERPVVVLAINGFRDLSRAKEMLYVGLSRARTLLVVCGDLQLIAAVGGEAVRLRLTTQAANSRVGWEGLSEATPTVWIRAELIQKRLKW